jgi:hypothetical protein
MRLETFERSVDKIIRRRYWTDVAGFWLNEIPIIDPPGSAPEVSLGEFVALSGLGNSINEEPMVLMELEGFRRAVLREAIFLLHKCAHVISIAEENITTGRLTWSISDAYHGAFFGAKAIMALLGVGFFDLGSRSVLFNVWPIGEKEEQKRKRLPVVTPQEVAFMATNTKLEHRHVWSMFCRCLRVVSVPMWPKSVVDALKNLDPKSLSRQRNVLHYSNHRWIYPDLHHRLLDNKFGIRNVDEDIGLEPAEDSDFSVLLGLWVLRLGRDLLSHLETRLLDNERTLFAAKIQDGWHPLFAQNFIL